MKLDVGTRRTVVGFDWLGVEDGDDALLKGKGVGQQGADARRTPGDDDELFSPVEPSRGSSVAPLICDKTDKPCRTSTSTSTSKRSEHKRSVVQMQVTRRNHAEEKKTVGSVHGEPTPL